MKESQVLWIVIIVKREEEVKESQVLWIVIIV